MASSAEASARTIEAAVAAAAAQLGLPTEQVEVEVLADPVPSTFGVIGQPARVRVTPLSSSAPLPAAPAGRGAPTQATTTSPSPGGASPDRAADGVAPVLPGSSEGGMDGSSAEAQPSADDIAADTELAGDFIEGLLDLLDVDGDITTWTDQAGGHVEIEGPELGRLVGRDGETLAALQELTRLAVVRQTRRRSRITLDVQGFRRRHRHELTAAAQEAAQRVLSSGEPEDLGPMSAYDRKIVHDAVAAIAGVRTESWGEEPQRRVVIQPA